MKLIWKIVLRISLAMTIVLAAWAILFHNAVIDEVNDEIDDSLELFSDNIIEQLKKGEILHPINNGTNNTYFIDTLSRRYGKEREKRTYSNESIYIQQLKESEPSRVLRTTFHDDNGSYLLTVATPTIDTDDLRDAITNWIIFLCATLLIIITLISFWILWRCMRPLYILLRWLDNTDIAQGVQPLNNPTKISEFIKLNDAVLRSIQRSEQLYSQQKQFIGNASHELQTPLAVCQSRLDLLTETVLEESQLEDIIKTQQTLSYISRLNKELLMLTKIDGGQFIDKTEVNISELVLKSVNDCSMIYEDKEIKVKTNAPNPVILFINHSLASILINNLIKNAYVHNYKWGEINITVNSNSIKISNTGDATTLDNSKIFERFYQGSKRDGCTGLGLALTKAVADMYRFQLKYTYEENFHTFIVSFKK